MPFEMEKLTTTLLILPFKNLLNFKPEISLESGLKLSIN